MLVYLRGFGMEFSIQIPWILRQFKDVEIKKNITQPIGQLVKLDEASIKSLNVMAIRGLLDVDVCLPLKQMFGNDPNMLPDEGAKGLGLTLPDTKDELIFASLNQESSRKMVQVQVVVMLWVKTSDEGVHLVSSKGL
ncbi:hypothetical protein D8674_019052 [Pyrus ussuriensis x Pyrus communis]|uniref:Uncharacterized protein n=1 Tax=Pyrus ussuriensis x Pyrus communis TaxID=2448454 RepID=A0A5N5GBW5_9ROSA|nr:hypothetical protein D8674_019052 [Pyrus ussuriensis x Pyrus communis]